MQEKRGHLQRLSHIIHLPRCEWLILHFAPRHKWRIVVCRSDSFHGHLASQYLLSVRPKISQNNHLTEPTSESLDSFVTAPTAELILGQALGFSEADQFFVKSHLTPSPI